MYIHITTHSDNRSTTRVAGFGKLLLVALFTENALLLKDEHGVLQLLLTTVADKVFRMPATTHGRGVGTPV